MWTFCRTAEFKEMMTFCSDTKGLTKSKYCLKWWKLKIIYWQVMKEFWSATLWTYRKLGLILLLNGYFSHVKYFDTKLYRGYELSIRSNANNYATVIYYRKPTKLLEGNVFSPVCPSVHSLTLTWLYRCNQPPFLFTWTSQYRDPIPTPSPTPLHLLWHVETWHYTA